MARPGRRWTAKDIAAFAKKAFAAQNANVRKKANPPKQPSRPPPCPSEHQEQAAFFEALEKLYPKLIAFAIPNGGWRDPITGFLLKKEGVKAGVPDIFIARPSGRFHGLFIEMKAIRNSRVRKNQEETIAALNAEGYAAIVCYGAREALLCLDYYLKKSWEQWEQKAKEREKPAP